MFGTRVCDNARTQTSHFAHCWVTNAKRETRSRLDADSSLATAPLQKY